MKKRLDQLLVELGLAPTRQRAKALIMEGKVLIGTTVYSKAGHMVDDSSEIRLKNPDLPYVSRGGLKLEHALNVFNVDVKGKIAMDVGASTGGFTDCLLQRGALRVYAIDVGYGQLALKLRNDTRVIPIERINIRYIDKEMIKDKVDIAVVDVSFISLKKVIPSVLTVLEGGELICLIKPQFESKREDISKGGIVKDDAIRQRAVQEVKAFFEEIALSIIGICESPIKGQKGNIEFLIYANCPKTGGRV
ncbi:MAG: TlyA family RNA methyltransferase [Candidatus Magnetoovum sp. WYHC-5]|nr:TlyA family RNA methyltransferase [Candidatus Magnetoovum sp. WYHC-5]